MVNRTSYPKGVRLPLVIEIALTSTSETELLESRSTIPLGKSIGENDSEGKDGPVPRMDMQLDAIVEGEKQTDREFLQLGGVKPWNMPEQQGSSDTNLAYSRDWTTPEKSDAGLFEQSATLCANIYIGNKEPSEYTESQVDLRILKTRSRFFLKHQVADIDVEFDVVSSMVWTSGVYKRSKTRSRIEVSPSRDAPPAYT